MAAGSFHLFDESAAPALDPWRVVAGFAPYLRLAHHIPGRVRFKFDLAVIEDSGLRGIGAEHLRAAVASLRGVRAVQFNALARSCVVEYDNHVIPDAAWPDLLGGRDTPAAAMLLAILQERCAEAGRA